MEWIYAEAPSNIALIKYMGKTEANVSTNASLSLTLDHLRTRVRVRFEKISVDGSSTAFAWRPLNEDGFHAPKLSTAGQQRFLQHAERCLSRLAGSRRDQETLVVESANGFPSDCGLASSASSFAALTLAVAKLVGLDIETLENRIKLAELSREGSGSSCRSLFSPWAVWRGKGALPVEGFPSLPQIRHLAILVDDEKKAVSSSQAHRRVTSSLLFRGRVERAEDRLKFLTEDLMVAASAAQAGVAATAAWNRAARTVWAESWDMHALFETSDPPFGYFVPGSVRALNALRDVASELTTELGESVYRQPMVTMDAGPNVHVILWNDEAATKTIELLKSKLSATSGEAAVRIIDSNQFGERA